MLVPVCVDAAANEWSVVEFQGQLVSEELRGAEIGALRFADGVPTLRVGNHVLEGKVVKLAKPFAVLHKEPASDSSAGPDGMMLLGMRAT